MKTRVITAIAILAVVIPCLFFGGVWMEGLILFIVAVGTYEFSKLADDQLPLSFVLFLIALEMIGLYLPSPLVFPYVGILFLLMLSLPVWHVRFTPKDSFICMSFMAFFILVGNAVQDIYAHGARFMTLIIVATYGCDTFAYLCGRFFGKHKLNERISPKKTIEGSIGGWLFGFLLSLLFWKLFMFENEFRLVLLAGIFCPIFGQIGDLAFSAIKRCYKIKDFGNLLPGHGGILDRVDSLLFNMVCFYFLMILVSL